MNPSVRWLSFGTGVRVSGYAMVVTFFFLYLRNVYGLAYDEIGVLVALTGILPLAILPAAGLLADRVGRRRLLILSLMAEAAALLLLALAVDLRWLVGLLIFVTLVQTVGAVGSPAIPAYIADFAMGSERTMANTWVRIGGNLGFAVGVLVGGVLITAIGFVNVALFAGILILASAATLGIVLAPSPFEKGRTVAMLGATKRLSWMDSVVRSLRVLSRDRIFLLFCVAVALVEITADQLVVIDPLYVNTVLSLPYTLVGAGLAINGVIVAVGQAPMTRIAIGHHHTKILAVGAVLYAVGFLLLGLPAVLGIGILAIFALSTLVVTLGENLEAIPFTTLPSNLAPSPAEYGSYNGAFAALSGVGALLAPVIGGLVLVTFSSPIVVWGLLVLPTVPAILLLTYLTPRIPGRANYA